MPGGAGMGVLTGVGVGRGSNMVAEVARVDV